MARARPAATRLSAPTPVAAGQFARWLSAVARVEVVLLIALVVATVLVRPFGEYALDDEWGYVKSLEHLHRDGVFKILDWFNVSLLAQLFWALLFTKTLGFSFTATKLSIVVLYYVECVALIAVLRHVGVARRLIWLAALTLLVNPLHFFHGFLFDSDVPAIASGLVALLFYLRAFDEEGYRQATALVLGSLFAGLSFLVRQPGILLPLALFLFLVIYDRPRLRSPWFMAHAFAPVVLIAVVFTYWYQHVHGATATFSWSEGQTIDFLLHPSPELIARIAFTIAIYVGFFVFPLSLTTLRAPRPSRAAPAARPARGHASAGSARDDAATLIVLGIAVGLAMMIVYLAVGRGETFPYLRNKVTPFGYLRPNEIILGNRDVLWPTGTAWAATIVFALSFLAFCYQLLAARRVPFGGESRDAARRVTRLVTLLCGLQLGYCYATWTFFFDRHLLILLPNVLIVLAVAADRIAVHEGSQPAPARAIVFGLALLPFAFYAVAGTHDVHASARTAFQAGEDLLREGVPANRIDAGYAFDGWYVYERQANGVHLARPHDAWWVRSLFPTIRTDYVVSLSPTIDHIGLARTITQPDRGALLAPDLSGYEIYKTYPYRTFWPFEEQRLYVLVDPAARQP